MESGRSNIDFSSWAFPVHVDYFQIPGYLTGALNTRPTLADLVA